MADKNMPFPSYIIVIYNCFNYSILYTLYLQLYIWRDNLEFAIREEILTVQIFLFFFLKKFNQNL